MADGTKAPSGVIENTGFIVVATAIGDALADDITNPKWAYVVMLAAPLVGKYLQMILRAMIGDNVGAAIKSFTSIAVAGLALTFGLVAGAPAAADDHPAKAIGCGGGTCSIYFVSAGWPPAIGVNAVEWVRGAFGAGLGGLHAEGDMSILGGVCLIPRVGPALGPFCPQPAEVAQ